MLSRDFLACCLGFLLLHAIDMEGAMECPLVFRFARLGVFEHDWSTHNRAGCLGLEYCTKIEHALGVGRIIQCPLMIQADDDIGLLLIHRVQNPCIGAISLIADHHISCLEPILPQALPGLRLGNLDVMQAKGDQVDHQVEPIIAGGGAWALHRGPITR